LVRDLLDEGVGRVLRCFWRLLYHGCSEILDPWLFVVVEDLEGADLAFLGRSTAGIVGRKTGIHLLNELSFAVVLEYFDSILVANDECMPCFIVGLSAISKDTC
jgi:hypothetical protein